MEGNHIMKTIFYFVLFTLLAGCATSKSIQGPNGTEAFVISCRGNNIEDCYEKAAEVCPNGYKFLDRGENQNTAVIPVGSSFMAVRGKNKILIECGRS